MKSPRPATVDFETFGIEGRPDYPPAPVGVAIKKWGKKGKYYAWGHPTANNCSRDEAIEALREVWDGDLLFHHCKFDLDVSETHLGLALPVWEKVHDTTFLLFLADPHQREVGLKPSAHRLLGLAPGERDAVADWLMANQPVEGVRITKKTAGKYIAYAPGDIVGAYAVGDDDRTEALFRKLYLSVCHERGMLGAYDRERRLVPILLDMERRGIRVDLRRLRADVKTYSDVVYRLESWVKRRLGVTDGFNLDSGDQLVQALVEANLADPSKMLRTPTGKLSASKESLAAGVLDRQLGASLRYLAALKTCLGTFMGPWLAVAERSGGLIFTNWNQIRGERGGTRTGRFSSTPNFQNIPTEFEDTFKDVEAPFILPPLPMCRSYVVPCEKGHVLVGRDYSQQEPRILGHFEDGVLCEQYRANPWIDFHDNAKEHLERIFNRTYARKPVKNINLGIIYGEGITALAAKNNDSYEETKQLRDAIYSMYPGLKQMYQDMKRRARMNEPVRTWGGREYYCEPPSFFKGKIVEWDYKMVNVLIQGSAADCTKEGMIRFANHVRRKRNWYIILQVHDEIVVSVPKEDLKEAQELLRECMESVEFDVPILSEGAWSAKNWASMKAYDKKGVLSALV
jgi:DNA polymerase-1